MKESDLITKCKKYCTDLRKQGIPIKFLKLHGSQFSETGTPDIHVTFEGRSFWIEAKIDDEKPSDIQEQRLIEWGSAGAVTGVVWTLADFIQILRSSGVPDLR